MKVLPVEHCRTLAINERASVAYLMPVDFHFSELFDCLWHGLRIGTAIEC